MDDIQTSLQLLSHFDDSAAPATAEVGLTPRIERTLGIGWVLKWTVAMAVLLYATTVLTEFGYSLAAEQLLAHAARAGALEATLPRATVHTVEQSIRRQLAGYVTSGSD